MYFLVLLFLFLGITACKKEEKLLYDNRSDISAIREQEFSSKIQSLNIPYGERMLMSVVYDLESLKSDGLIDIVRYNKEKDMFYSVSHMEGGQYLFLLYEEFKGSYHMIDGFLVSTLADKALFENISRGMKQEEIIKDDPSSCIYLNHSYHRFSDKSMLRVDYTVENTHYIVSDFEFIENTISVLDYLLPKDLEQILP
ncbi:hypothetical protein HNQ56_003088 [Anaerotaenia torta]|uniref:hypothetical protein n=1 Tax=Anaerotaenia torta TaxID=433293 RepID=UPI003D1B7CA7